MSFLFGGAPPTTTDLAKRYKRHIQRSIRDLDKESARLASEEKILMGEVKQASHNNIKMSLQKAQAVVRVRRTLNKFSVMKSHFQGIETRIQGVKSTEALQRSVTAAANMMRSFNKTMGGHSMLASLQELERQNMLMTVQGECIDEQMDGIFEEDNDEEASEDVVLQILTEAGVCLPSPSTLEERLDRLKPPTAVKTNAK